MSYSTHTDRNYEAELRRLRERILLMGTRIEAMIARSIDAFLERDADAAAEIIRSDAHVNALEVEIDELCLHILALRQPAASDLRTITTALKLVTDMERIGDLAVKVAERTRDLARLGPHPLVVDVGQVSNVVLEMVHGALEAYVSGDIHQAKLVIERDTELDELYHDGFRRTLRYMLEDPSGVERGITLQSVLKYLERMGDHATNLAELVIFMVKGQDIRHGNKR